jgi:hypothetical protein
MKYKVLFSEKAAKFCGSNTILLNGKRVEYTCLHSIDTDWKSHYMWDDAVVIGETESLDSVHPCHKGMDDADYEYPDSDWDDIYRI